MNDIDLPLELGTLIDEADHLQEHQDEVHDALDLCGFLMDLPPDEGWT